MKKNIFFENIFLIWVWIINALRASWFKIVISSTIKMTAYETTFTADFIITDYFCDF